MTPHIDDLNLIDLSLGTDHDPHLDLCSRCRDAGDEITEALHLLALTLPPIAPPPELRVRLLAAVAGPVSDHAGALAGMFERPEPELRALLQRLERGQLPWTPAFPGIEHHSVSAGHGRDCGLFRVAPGVLFPHHRHVGEERMRVLQGSCSDSLGVVLGPGDEHSFPAGTAHALLTHHGPPLVLAYVSHGTEFTGLPL
jgi:anti-sigma factor ChrR (cupin superfamily)